MSAFNDFLFGRGKSKDLARFFEMVARRDAKIWKFFADHKVAAEDNDQVLSGVTEYILRRGFLNSWPNVPISCSSIF